MLLDAAAIKPKVILMDLLFANNGFGHSTYKHHADGSP